MTDPGVAGLRAPPPGPSRPGFRPASPELRAVDAGPGLSALRRGQDRTSNGEQTPEPGSPSLQCLPFCRQTLKV